MSSDKILSLPDKFIFIVHLQLVRAEETLINDIDSDLDRFYDVADSINVCVEDIEVE